MSKLGIGVYFLSLVLFGLLAYFAHLYPIFPGDIAIGRWLQGIDSSVFQFAMRAISIIDSTIWAAIIVAIFALSFWLSGRKQESTFIVLLTSASVLLNWLLKSIVVRPRANTEFIVLVSGGSGLSFPSGHAVYAVAFYGFLFYLALSSVKHRLASVASGSCLLLLIVLTCVSRVSLGAHWFSDVVGGFLLGWLMLAPIVILYRNRKAVREENRILRRLL